MSPTPVKPADIACACGACAFTVADGKITMKILCGCEDCRQALQWGHSKGGVKPDPLPQLVYFRSDVIDVKGRDKMIAVQLRENALSTRVYCTSCYSVLGVDAPAYMDSVFLNFPKHCVNGGDLDAPLSLMLFMHDYHESLGPVPEDKVPVFQSLRFPQEQERLFAIEASANTWWKKPTEPPTGMRFSSLIKSLGPPLILNRDRDKEVLV